MKTKDEIKKHLKCTSYGAEDIIKIMGFLIGKGIKAADETMQYFVGDDKLTFNDFLEWFNSESVDKANLKKGDVIVFTYDDDTSLTVLCLGKSFNGLVLAVDDDCDPYIFNLEATESVRLATKIEKTEFFNLLHQDFDLFSFVMDFTQQP